MPELPDVEGFKQYLDSTALHQEIMRTSVLDERILDKVSARTLALRLKGAQLEAGKRHGKFLFVRTTEGGRLVLHFGMTGELRYYRHPRDRPEYAKLILHFVSRDELAYVSKRVLGRVSYVEQPEPFIEEQGLGPDALSEALDKERFLQLLAERRGMIKSALMDQSLLAGIGNVYSDEILFQSGLHPERKVEQLSRQDQKKLYRTLRRVLRKAAESGGALDELPAGYLLPHRQGDGVCPRCGRPLKRTPVSGRTAYFCPHCQG